jgi:hypothetical protein
MIRINDQPLLKLPSVEMKSIICFLIFTLSFHLSFWGNVNVSIWDAQNKAVGDFSFDIELDSLADVAQVPGLIQVLNQDMPYLIAVRREFTDIKLPGGFVWVLRVSGEDDPWLIAYERQEIVLGVEPSEVDTTCQSHISLSPLPDGVWMILTRRGDRVELNHIKSVKNGRLHGEYYRHNGDGRTIRTSYRKGLRFGTSTVYKGDKLLSWEKYDQCGFSFAYEVYYENGTLQSKWDASIMTKMWFDETGCLVRLGQQTVNGIEFGVSLFIGENGELEGFENRGGLNRK